MSCFPARLLRRRLLNEEGWEDIEWIVLTRTRITQIGAGLGLLDLTAEKEVERFKRAVGLFVGRVMQDKDMELTGYVSPEDLQAAA